MKFIIEYNGNTEQRLLIYDVGSCSFDTEPTVLGINFDLALNYLTLTGVDDNKIVQVWGFCGYNTWLKSNFHLPDYKKGVLKVEDNLEGGIGSYAIYNEELPVYVNIQTGWVCIGNPENPGNAVEFITNCLAVIDDNIEFVSLWLKPQSLPIF